MVVEKKIEVGKEDLQKIIGGPQGTRTRNSSLQFRKSILKK